MDFWIFEIFEIFLDIFWISWGFLRILGIFEFFFEFLKKIWGDFLDFFWIFSNLLRSLLKVTEVTTKHQKWPKISKNSTQIFFFAQRAKKA